MASPSDINEIYLSSSPHYSSGRSTKGVMAAVIGSMLPLCIFGVYTFGVSALITILTSVISCVGFEALFQYVTKQKIRVGDFSAAVTGIMLALVLPPAAPIWMNILGSFFAVVVAKGFFGGIGANVFNPALIGRAFMFVSFPVAMTTWTQPIQRAAQAVSGASYLDATSSATILSSVKNGTAALGPDTYIGFFLGNRAGCIGETSILLIAIAGLFLLVTRIIDWRAPLSMIAVTVLCTWAAGGDPLFAVLSGGLLFGAVFMVTDYATAPVSKGGRLVFGAGCGLITFLIRQFGGFPEGVMFSILIMNAVVPFLNKIMGKKYGFVKPAKKAQGASK